MPLAFVCADTVATDTHDTRRALKERENSATGITICLGFARSPFLFVCAWQCIQALTHNDLYLHHWQYTAYSTPRTRHKLCQHTIDCNTCQISATVHLLGREVIPGRTHAHTPTAAFNEHATTSLHRVFCCDASTGVHPVHASRLSRPVPV